MGTILLEVSIGRDLGALKGLKALGFSLERLLPWSKGNHLCPPAGGLKKILPNEENTTAAAAVLIFSLERHTTSQSLLD